MVTLLDMGERRRMRRLNRRTSPAETVRAAVFNQLERKRPRWPIDSERVPGQCRVGNHVLTNAVTIVWEHVVTDGPTTILFRMLRRTGWHGRNRRFRTTPAIWSVAWARQLAGRLCIFIHVCGSMTGYLIGTIQNAVIQPITTAGVNCRRRRQ